MKKAKQTKYKEKTTPPHLSRSQLTFGQRASDKLTEIMGSWVFIFTFFIFLTFWMTINAIAWKFHWDPFPFILLNLCLSCLAAFQAPIILMSSNRQAERDRITAKYDYAVNRKAEREIQEIKKSLESIEKLLTKNINKKTI